MPVKKDKGTITTPKSKDKGASRLNGGANNKDTSKPNTNRAKTTSTGDKSKAKVNNNKGVEQGKTDNKELIERVSKTQIKYSLEQKTKIAHAILSVYATGKYTLESCCEAQGVTDRTFRGWVTQHVELSELYEEYKESMREISKQELRKMAEKSLEKLVKGGEYEESVTVVTMDKGKPVVKEVRKTKKIVQPNTAAVLFTLTNLDPKQWRNTQLIEGKLNINAQVKAVEGMTDEQLQAEIDRLSKNPPAIPEV